MYFSQTVTSVEIIYQEFAPVMLPGKGINDGTPAVSATNEASWSDRLPTTRGIAIGGVDYTIEDAIVLPVKLVSFSGIEKNCNNQLNWTVTEALNLQKFQIEKSNDGRTFTVIGTEVYNGNRNNYTFTDLGGAAGSKYYRLKMIDYDGYSTVSTVLSLTSNCKKRNVVEIIPNPVLGKTVKVYLSGFEQGSYKILVYNTLGQTIGNSTIDVNASGQMQKDIQLAQLVGFAVLKVFRADGIEMSSHKILVK